MTRTLSAFNLFLIFSIGISRFHVFTEFLCCSLPSKTFYPSFFSINLTSRGAFQISSTGSSLIMSFTVMFEATLTLLLYFYELSIFMKTCKKTFSPACCWVCASERVFHKQKFHIINVFDYVVKEKLQTWKASNFSSSFKTINLFTIVFKHSVLLVAVLPIPSKHNNYESDICKRIASKWGLIKFMRQVNREYEAVQK